eukprot:sb/3460630/
MVRRRERERERHRQRERQINITLQGVEVKSGTPATLTCTVSNLESDVTITWEKDSVVMESGASGVTMTTDIKQSGGSQQSVLVVDAPVTDAVYTCKVVEGSGYMTADVNVYDVTVSDFEVVSGSTISLTCDVTDHSGGMKITWKDSSGTQLGTNTAQPSLVTVVTPSGSGTYTCETESTWKSSSPVCSTTANVDTYTVSSTSAQVAVGERAVLSCEIKGVKEEGVQVTWSANGNTIGSGTDQGSVLNSDQISTFTKDVAPETTGQVTYTCTVKSKALPNSPSYEETLNLWTYDVSLQHREVIVGSTVTLMVSVSGVPSTQPIKVAWTGQSENDVTVANGNGDTVISKLTVGEASAMDVGVTVESVNHPASTVYTGNVKLETFRTKKEVNYTASTSSSLLNGSSNKIPGLDVATREHILGKLTSALQENIKSSGMATCLCKCPRETAIALEGELFEGCTVVSIYKSRALTKWGCWAYQGDLKYAILALNSNSYFCYSPSKDKLRLRIYKVAHGLLVTVSEVGRQNGDSCENKNYGSTLDQFLGNFFHNFFPKNQKLFFHSSIHFLFIYDWKILIFHHCAIFLWLYRDYLLLNLFKNLGEHWRSKDLCSQEKSRSKLKVHFQFLGVHSNHSGTKIPKLMESSLKDAGRAKIMHVHFLNCHKASTLLSTTTSSALNNTTSIASNGFQRASTLLPSSSTTSNGFQKASTVLAKTSTPSITSYLTRKANSAATALPSRTTKDCVLSKTGSELIHEPISPDEELNNNTSKGERLNGPPVIPRFKKPLIGSKPEHTAPPSAARFKNRKQSSSFQNPVIKIEGDKKPRSYQDILPCTPASPSDSVLPNLADEKIHAAIDISIAKRTTGIVKKGQFNDPKHPQFSSRKRTRTTSPTIETTNGVSLKVPPETKRQRTPPGRKQERAPDPVIKTIKPEQNRQRSGGRNSSSSSSTHSRSWTPGDEISLDQTKRLEEKTMSSDEDAGKGKKQPTEPMSKDCLVKCVVGQLQFYYNTKRITTKSSFKKIAKALSERIHWLGACDGRDIVGVIKVLSEEFGDVWEEGEVMKRIRSGLAPPTPSERTENQMGYGAALQNIKFTVGEGRMLERCPSRYRCSATFPMWLNGEHPTSNEIEDREKGIGENDSPSSLARCRARENVREDSAGGREVEGISYPKSQGTALVVKKPTKDQLPDICAGGTFKLYEDSTDRGELKTGVPPAYNDPISQEQELSNDLCQSSDVISCNNNENESVYVVEKRIWDPGRGEEGMRSEKEDAIREEEVGEVIHGKGEDASRSGLEGGGNPGEKVSPLEVDSRNFIGSVDGRLKSVKGSLFQSFRMIYVRRHQLELGSRFGRSRFDEDASRSGLEGGGNPGEKVSPLEVDSRNFITFCAIYHILYPMWLGDGGYPEKEGEPVWRMGYIADSESLICQPQYYNPVAIVKCGDKYYHQFTRTRSNTGFCVEEDVSDLCNNAVELLEEWRGTTVDKDRDHCDTNGLNSFDTWYRMGIFQKKMPDHCVAPNRCGGDTGYYVGGGLGHPKPSEGIVGRLLKYSSATNCQASSLNAWILNCGDEKKDDFIYKFNKPSGCDRTFCIEENPCSSTVYTKLSDEGRAGREASHDKIDDSKLDHGWYRFMGGEGIMTRSPILPGHSGATYPGWYDGEYPEDEGQEKTGRACFVYNSATCNKQRDVTVRNCGQFFVYHLQRTDSANGYTYEQDVCKVETNKLDQAYRAQFDYDALAVGDQALVSGWYEVTTGKKMLATEPGIKLVTLALVDPMTIICKGVKLLVPATTTLSVSRNSRSIRFPVLTNIISPQVPTNPGSSPAGSHPTEDEGIVMRKVYFSTSNTNFMGSSKDIYHKGFTPVTPHGPGHPN